MDRPITWVSMEVPLWGILVNYEAFWRNSQIYEKKVSLRMKMPGNKARRRVSYWADARIQRVKPISGPPHPPEALHTHIKHFTPFSGPSHSSQALYTHLKPFSSISGPPHPPQVMHTHLRLSMPILGPLHSSLALHSHLRPHTPVPDPPGTRGMVFHLV